MKNYILLIFIVFNISAFSQQKPFQIELGANNSWFVYNFDIINEIEEDFRPMINFGARYSFADIYGINISAGLRYFALERAVTVDFLPYNGQATEFDHYLLSLPLQIAYQFDVINTSLIVNIEPAYILKSKVKDISPFDMNHVMTERDVTDQMNRFQFAIGGGLEYKFDLFSQSFGFKTVYNYYLTEVPKSGIFKRDGGNEYQWAEFKVQEVYLVISYYL